MSFAQPVAVQPNTTYVASYYAPNGHYAATSEYFYRSPSPGPNGGALADAPPLHAVRNSGTTVNGLYGYGSSSVFPTASYKASNYWVDVNFSPTPAPGQVTGVSASEGGKNSANVTWSAPTTGGTPTSYKITPYVGSTAQTPKVVDAPATSTTVTGLTTGTTYRFTVTATNPNGDGPASAQSNAVTPSAAVVPAAPTNVKAQPGTSSAQVSWTAAAADGDSPVTGQTVTPYIDGNAQTPVQVGAAATSTTVTGLTNGTSYTFKVSAANAVGSSPQSAASPAVTPQNTIFGFTTPVGSTYVDHTPVELGVKFTADYSGTITGVRFYKAAENVGTHVGSLWSASGQRLAQATFTNESSSGWQAVTFATPVAVTAGTTYVASYYSPEGAYTATSFGLASAVDGGPVQTVPNATSSNGVYAYGAASNFPQSSYDGANYWVDVLYALSAPGQPGGVTATASGASSATVNWTAPTSGGPVDSYRITPYVGSHRADRQGEDRQRPGDDGHGRRPHVGHDLHVPRRGGQRERPRAGVGRVERRHPDGGRRARGAVQRPRGAGDDVRARDLGRADHGRRQPDHRADGDAVHRRQRPDPGPGRRVGDEHHRERPDQRDGLHVQGHGDERGRHVRRVGRVQRRDAADDALRLRLAVGRRLG